MRKRLITYLVLIAILLLMAVAAGPALAVSSTLVINEIDYDQPSTDTAEFIEIKNVSAGTINLDDFTLELVNGTGGGASVYNTIDLPNVDLDPGEYYVVCGNAANVANCDLDVSPDSNLIQNGAPDAVALVLGGSIVDTVSYEGNTGVPYTEGSGADLVDDPGQADAGISRVPDGTDTDVNNADFSFQCITPGAANECAPPPPPPAVSIYDIQFTTDPGGDSPYTGQTVTTQGIVTAFFYDGGNRYTFIQDGTGPWSGLLLFRPNGSVIVGDLVEVEGEVSEYYGLTEIAYGDVTVLNSSNPLPAPEVLASGDVSQEQWESVLVRVENVSVTDDDLGYGEWLVDDGSGGVCVDDLGSYGYSPTNGDWLDFVQGPLYYSYGNFKIEPRDDNDISLAPPPPPVVTIMEIQGNGQFSPYDGQVVETSGVVTLFTANGANFWLQDPAGDGDPGTSDGIFASGGGYPDVGSRPEVGDFIRIIAQVQEQQYAPALPLTRLRNVALIEVLSSDNPLPVPVELNDLPNESITDAIAFWEPLEGMLVSVRNAPVVAATSGFGEFGLLTKDDAKPGSGYFADSKQILLQNLGDQVVDYNPERIMVDDSSLDEAIIVQPGDRVRSLVGVVDYTFSMYKLQPATFDIKFHDLPKLPASTRSGGFGNVVITTYNVENLFDLLDNPDKADEGSTPTAEELDVQLAKLALSIEIELELPDIIVAQEVENTAILQELGDRVNADTGTAYVATSFETSDARGIEVGFLWDANRVDLQSAEQMSGPDVEAWFGPSSPSPGREPLVGTFDIKGEKVTIIGNHFKSKGGDDPLYLDGDWPPNRVTEIQRKGQAQTVRNFVNTILDEDSNALLMVTGDLNDFQFSEPGEGPDHPLAILEGIYGGVPLINLLNLEKDAETFTYVYDGNAQALDHMLVSPALYQLFQAVDVLHFNTTTPEPALAHDASSPLSASDHDPLEGRFKFK